MNPIVRAFWNRWLGDRGEREAARFLRRRGLRVLIRGYRTDQGEVDLIARDGDTLVFVEVKSRRQGEPAEAVTPEKQRRLTLAALHFLRRHDLLEQPCRFDVVADRLARGAAAGVDRALPPRLRGRRPGPDVPLISAFAVSTIGLAIRIADARQRPARRLDRICERTADLRMYFVPFRPDSIEPGKLVKIGATTGDETRFPGSRWHFGCISLPAKSSGDGRHGPRSPSRRCVSDDGRILGENAMSMHHWTKGLKASGLGLVALAGTASAQTRTSRARSTACRTCRTPAGWSSSSSTRTTTARSRRRRRSTPATSPSAACSSGPTPTATAWSPRRRPSRPATPSWPRSRWSGS